MNKNDHKDSSRDMEIKHISDEYRNTKDNALKKELSDFSGMSPEVVAQLIRSWMNSEDK